MPGGLWRAPGKQSCRFRCTAKLPVLRRPTLQVHARAAALLLHPHRFIPTPLACESNQLLQEKIMQGSFDGERFTFSLFLVLCNRLTTMSLAVLMLLVRAAAAGAPAAHGTAAHAMAAWHSS